MTKATIPADLSIRSLRPFLMEGHLDPRDLMDDVIRRLDRSRDSAVWISTTEEKELRSRASALADLQKKGLHRNLPLFGLPFAVKDNIDVAGRPTTAGCPTYAYIPETSAPVVDHLLAAGAVLIGKTNMDQFATGLVGTRSPYGVARNPFRSEFIPGGSSSGSAVAVAMNLVSFSLGTDTAGSGRIPAAFNNIVGLKPTRGYVSTRGVVPACRSLDCVSVFSLTVEDAIEVLHVIGRFDALDSFSRPRPPNADSAFPSGERGFRFGVPSPSELAFFGDTSGERVFHEAVTRLQEIGGECVIIPYEPFREASDLLYGGPWLAERFAAVGDFIRAHPHDVLDVTRSIIMKGESYSAAEAFQAYYKLRELKRQTNELWSRIDCLVLPTAGRCYRIAEMERDPVGPNADLGYYANFVNLLDLCAVSVPSGFSAEGVPVGISFIGPAWSDFRIASIASRFCQDYRLHSGKNEGEQKASLPSKKPAGNSDMIPIAVVGAHITGEPLNHELIDIGGVFRCRGRTEAAYRLYALPGPPPARPGLVRVNGEGGHAIEIEVWDIPTSTFHILIQRIPSPLGIGTVRLSDGTEVKGFVCEGFAVEGAEDISKYGGWRNYREARDRS